jgi:hypothetical protein
VRRTRNVETLATSVPHDSAIISSVSACVPVSIPLLTNIRSGIFSWGIRGCSSSSTFLTTQQGFAGCSDGRLYEISPESLRWYRKQHYIHLLQQGRAWKVWPYCLDPFWEGMICQVFLVSSLLVERFHKLTGASPEIDSVSRIRKMIRQTRAEVACAQDQNTRGRFWCRRHTQLSEYKVVVCSVKGPD